MSDFFTRDGAALTSLRDDWETPQALFDALDERFHFTLDPCSTHENAKCAKHYTVDDDGLSKSWEDETVFCNPPYGRNIGKWVEKCARESERAKIVLLIPARTDTAYFHDYIYGKAEIAFIRGRLRFERQGIPQDPAPFPSLLAYYGFDSEIGGNGND